MQDQPQKDKLICFAVLQIFGKVDEFIFLSADSLCKIIHNI